MKINKLFKFLFDFAVEAIDEFGKLFTTILVSGITIVAIGNLAGEAAASFGAFVSISINLILYLLSFVRNLESIYVLDDVMGQLISMEEELNQIKAKL